nr:PAS domain S-box protein [Dechloromonas sp.]
MSKQQERISRPTLGVFLIVFVVCGIGIALFENYRLAVNRADAVEMAEHKARQIERQLGHGLSATYALAGLVKLGKGQVADFEQVAAQFLPHYPGVASLQLAPAGVIRQIVPLRGNEPAIGHDLLTDTKRNKEARLAVETRRLTLAGPFTLIQGGEAVVGRLPVFLGDSGQEFWGFTIAVIDFANFLSALELEDLAEQGYAYHFWRTHPDTGARQIFAESAARLADNPVAIPLEVPNGRWMLSLAPAAGWLGAGRLAFEIAAALVLSLLAALATRWYLLTQQRLAASEVRYRSLYNATPTMMHSIDAEGRIVSVSDAWLETLGYRRDEVIGRKSTDFLTEDSRRYANDQILPEFFRTGHCQDVEYRMLAADGRVLDVLLSAHGERDEEGRIIRSLSVIEDVTERKRTEQQLHRLLAEQKAIIENELVGIVRVRERTIIWANPAFEKMLGYGPGELNGLPTRHNYLDDEAYEAFGRESYPILAAGKVYRSQFQQRHRDGHTVWLNVSGAMLDREIGESLWAFVDISELRFALSRVARSEQRMELALAGASLGLWDWHIPSGAFVCNARMTEILGYAAGELQLDNDTYTGLINLADLPEVRRILYRHLKGETPMFEAEYRVRHKDEHWVWILCRGRVVERDAAGRAVRMTGTNLDISERKASVEAILTREARLARLMAAMQDLVVVFDAGGSVVEYFYPPGSRHPGQDESDPRGGRYVESLPVEIANQLADAMGEILLDGKSRTVEYQFAVDGEPLISMAILSPVMEAQATFPSGFLAIVRDVTTERVNQHRIEDLSRRNALLLDSVGEGIFGVDLEGRTTFVNTAALNLLGLAEEEVSGRPAHALFHYRRADGSIYPDSECPINRTLRDGIRRYTDTECFWRKDGGRFPVSLNVAPVIENGCTAGAVVVFQDITERRRAEESIRQLAYFDPLTQLPNSRLLHDRLAHALAATRRSGLHGALFFIDLDDFKGLNDRLGQAAGDQLLRQVAIRLIGCVREADTVARYGGDEFVLLCEGLGGDAEEASLHVERIGNKVLAALNQAFPLGEQSCLVTPSIGIALFAGGGKLVEQLISEAESAMRQAKAAGRNALSVFRSSTQGPA